MSESSAIPMLSEGLNNGVSFKRCLLDYASSKSVTVVNTILNGEDLNPPRAPDANAPPNDYRVYDNRYQESRLLVCGTLFQSCSKELQSRVNQNARQQYKSSGEVGKLWRFLKEIVRGEGFSDAMTHLTEMFSYRLSSPENVGTDYTRFVDSVEAIETHRRDRDTQYPEDVDSRLWIDIKTHKYVQALK